MKSTNKINESLEAVTHTHTHTQATLTDKEQGKRKLNSKFVINNNQEGVTLISLVVTIVILIILAAISINMIIGDNGILTQTERAKELTEQAEKDVQQEMTSLADEMQEITATPSMKILANSGSDGIVAIPSDKGYGNYNITIDWGDGVKENFTHEQTSGKYIINNGVEIATIGNEGIEVALRPIVPITHTYNKVNTEYVIKISGELDRIFAYSNDKILKILDWGELGAYYIRFDRCYNLTEIASPRENSFRNITDFVDSFLYCTSLISIPSDLFANCPNVTSFHGTFTGCTSLTSIPSNLFDNCSKVTDFIETFYGCTSLTGNSIRLWEDNNREKYGITENSGGWRCYYGCENLNDYNTIPDYWKVEYQD